MTAAPCAAKARAYAAPSPRPAPVTSTTLSSNLRSTWRSAANPTPADSPATLLRLIPLVGRLSSLSTTRGGEVAGCWHRATIHQTRDLLNAYRLAQEVRGTGPSDTLNIGTKTSSLRYVGPRRRVCSLPRGPHTWRLPPH